MALINPTPSIVLASASPRRSSILKQIGFNFEVMVSTHEEEFSNDIDLAKTNAKNKALEVSQRDNRLVLGCDTLVYLENQVLGKPKTKDHAMEILQKLNNKEHLVRTGVAFAQKGVLLSAKIAETRVFFRNNSPQELLDYVNSLEPMDKAGAYGIQGLGARLIQSICGCYYNVVGLPVALVLDMLKEVNHSYDFK